MNAFPIRSKNRGGLLTGGTGFFATYKDRFWLITAAHVALGENDQHGRWTEWPDTIAVLVGTGFTTYLFDDKRNPLFAYKSDGEKVADVLALDLSLIADHPLLAEVTPFDLTAPWSVKVGDQVTALGYPTDVDDWPQSAAVAKRFTAVKLSPGVIEHKHSAGNGMSGGPVLDRENALAGLVMGHNHGTGRAADLDAIRWIIDSSLPNLPPIERDH